MMRNIDEILLRSESLDALTDQSQCLSASASTFYKQAKKTKPSWSPFCHKGAAAEASAAAKYVPDATSDSVKFDSPSGRKEQDWLQEAWNAAPASRQSQRGEAPAEGVQQRSPVDIVASTT